MSHSKSLMAPELPQSYYEHRWPMIRLPSGKLVENRNPGFAPRNDEHVTRLTKGMTDDGRHYVRIQRVR